MPGMTVDWEVRVLRGPGRRDQREAQGRDREGSSEGSAERNRAPTNRNRIRGAADQGELAENSEVEFTGPFTSESVLIHRLVTPELFNVRFRHTDYGSPGRTDYYYVRVTQANNAHQAWSSPIWVEG